MFLFRYCVPRPTREQLAKRIWDELEVLVEEIRYRMVLSHDDLQTEFGNSVFAHVKQLSEVESFFSISNEMAARKFPIYMYAIPTPEGCVSRLPGDMVDHSYFLQVFIGTGTDFMAFLQLHQTEGWTPSLGDAGFVMVGD